MDAYLAVDIGTGNLRAAVLARDGAVLFLAHADVRYVQEARDRLSIDAGFLKSAVLRICREATLAAAAQGLRLVAVSSTSQREGIVLLDAENREIAILPNCDNRGKRYLSELNDPEALVSCSGRPILSVFSASKLMGLIQDGDGRAERINHVISISDWVGFLLTGRLGYERTQAANTALYDAARGTWSEMLCRAYGVAPDWLAPIVESGTVLGRVSAGAAEASGLSRGIPFIVGGSDMQMGVLGLNARAGDCVIVAGTTMPIAYLSDETDFFPQGVWNCPHVRPGLHISEINVAATGLNYQRFQRIFFSDRTFEELEEGIRPYVLPQCTAMLTSSPFADDGGVWQGGFMLPLPLSETLTAQDFVHAMQLDIAAAAAENVRLLEARTGRVAQRILGCGGGFSSRLMRQYLADILCREIELPANCRQASLAGCVRQCNRAVGAEDIPAAEAARITPQNSEALRPYLDSWRALRACFRAQD